MAITITELLGTDPFSSSRFVINANFFSIKSNFTDLESGLGISIISGNIDVSTAPGGSIKAKVMESKTLNLINPSMSNTIMLTGSTGAIVAQNITANAIVTAAIDAGKVNIGTNASVFDGQVTFNEMVIETGGSAINKVDVGIPSTPTTDTHTVINDDRVVIFDVTGSTLSIVPDASLLDGHVVTLINKNAASKQLDTANIYDFSSGTITFAGNYKSAITLMWCDAVGPAADKWIIIGSSNMTIT